MKILSRSALIIAAITLLSVLASMFYLMNTPPTYSATATLLVDPRARKLVTDEITQGGLTSDLALVESQVSILTSENVLGRVVGSENLTADSEFQHFSGSGTLAQLKNLIRGNRPTPDARSYAIERLSRAMKIHRAQKTYILEVEVETNSPSKSSRLANAIAQAYIDVQLQSKTDEARDANKLIDARIGELRNAVQEAETRVDEFKKANKIIVSEGGILAEQQLGKLNTELIKARAIAADARARRSLIESVLKSGTDAESLPDAVKSPVIQRLREQYSQVSRRAAALSQQLRSRHPVMLDIRSQQRELRAQIKQELNRTVAAARTEADISAKREKELVGSLEKAKAAVSRRNTAKIKLAELEREAAVNRDLLGAFMVRAKETQEQQNLSASNARVVSRASIPSFPSWPRPLLVLALAGLGGLGLGVATALTRDHFDTSVGDHATHTIQTSLPVLARLPKLRATAFQPKTISGRARDVLDLTSFVGLSDIMLALSDQTNARSNPFRQAVLQLLSRLMSATNSGATRTLLFVSPHRNAGTTSSALAVGYAAALSGERVLLVDAASADPELSNVFANNRDTTMAISLDNQDDLESLTVVDADSELSILPLAHADLRTLKSSQRRQLLEGLRKLSAAYDLVLIDAGAALEDATVLSLLAAADDVIVIARSGHTEADDLTQTERLLCATSDHILGTIATMDHGTGPRFI